MRHGVAIETLGRRRTSDSGPAAAHRRPVYRLGRAGPVTQLTPQTYKHTYTYTLYFTTPKEDAAERHPDSSNRRQRPHPLDFMSTRYPIRRRPGWEASTSRTPTTRSNAATLSTHRQMIHVQRYGPSPITVRTIFVGRTDGPPRSSTSGRIGSIACSGIACVRTELSGRQSAVSRSSGGGGRAAAAEGVPRRAARLRHSTAVEVTGATYGRSFGSNVL